MRRWGIGCVWGGSRHYFSWLICLLQTLGSYRFDIKVYIVLEGVWIWFITCDCRLRLVLIIGLSRCIFSSHECLTCVFDKVIKGTKGLNFDTKLILLPDAIVRNYNPWTVIANIRVFVLLVAWCCNSITRIMLLN